MATKSVQVVIGRSIGKNAVNGSSISLGAAPWGRFQAQIIRFLAEEGEFYRCILGTGVGTYGQVEENATVLGSISEEKLPHLRDLLTRLQIIFGQHAILLIVGELEVIS